MTTNRAFQSAVLATWYAAALGPAAASDTIPRWDIAEICSVSAIGAKCPTVESQNRKAVFQRWEALPVADRQACEATILASGQRSYRSLLACLQERQLRAVETVPHGGILPNSRDG